MPADFWTNPLMYQGGSDAFIGPRDPILAASETYGIDFESEIAIITDDVPMGIDKKNAGQHIKLLMLVNDVSLRNLIPGELAKGFGFFQSKPASSFSPVAITPDELGSHWDGQRVHLPLRSYLNGSLFGQPNAGVDMTFSFTELIQHAAKTRTLTAGTIIGSGTVSNLDRSKGSSCIAEKRMLEIIECGEAQTPFMHFGDSIRIEMSDDQGNSLFGAIDQRVECYTPELS
jgi:fumarylacetoacetate (FAA) hydrolase